MSFLADGGECREEVVQENTHTHFSAWFATAIHGHFGVNRLDDPNM